MNSGALALLLAGILLSSGLGQEDSPFGAVARCRPGDFDNPRIGRTTDCPGPLELALFHSDTRVRLAAISELTDGGSEGSAEILAAVALTDNEVAVREEAIFGLGEIGGEAGLPVLQQALADPDRRVREAAINAVADIGGDDSAWALATSLNDDDPALREQTIYALESIGGEAAIVLLKQALADEHDFIRRVAEEALEDLVD
jgi:HEAT repeat protein